MLNIAICDDDIQTTGQIEMLIESKRLNLG